MFDLTGRTALVTGATGGIGGAIAQALHAQGATVAISGTRREVLDTLAGKLGERVHVLPCNLSDAAEVEALVPSAEKAMGQVDILIANAGITKDNLFVQLRRIIGFPCWGGERTLTNKWPLRPDSSSKISCAIDDF